jgi:NAD(P)-dependent dehydrogenase (short-subunit alcohol dehydrogenase family)
MPLFGRQILITGGTRGLGRAMAKEFAARRARVCITGRREEEAVAAAAQLESEVGRERPDAGEPHIRGVGCEVTELRSVEEAVARCGERLGSLTDVVANAGEAGRYGRLDHLRPAEWKYTFSVNLEGTYHTFHAALQPILDAGGGSLIGLSGYGAVRAVPFLSPYSSSKAAVVQLVRVLAREFEDHPVRFLTFSPGLLEHGLSRDIDCTDEESHHYHNPYARALREYLRKPPEEAARLLASLVDPAYPVPSGAKISLHKPFEVSWAMARARLRALRGG